MRRASRKDAVGAYLCAVWVGAAFRVLRGYTRAQKGRFGEDRLDRCAGARIQVIEKRHDGSVFLDDICASSRIGNSC